AYDAVERALAAQPPVSDARRAPGAAGDLVRARIVDLHLQLARGAADDLLQVARRVEVEPVHDAEPVAQRTREQPRAGGGADQREPLERELDRPRARAVAD